jgi:hypothetical protein
MQIIVRDNNVEQALQLLLERAQRLLDIIVANNDLHKVPSHS